MDQLKEYRMRMEKRRLEQIQTSNNESQKSSKHEHEVQQQQKQQQYRVIDDRNLKAEIRREWGEGIHKKPPPGDWFKPQTEEEIIIATLKLPYRSVNDELKEREEKLNINAEVLRPNTEKKLFKEKMEKEKLEQLKREREEKRLHIESLRTQFLTEKKSYNSVDAAFTRFVDSKAAANISNRSPLTHKSISKSDDFEIFIPNEDEPRTPTSVPCMIQIRMIEGIILKAKFQSEDTLREICEYVIQMATGNIQIENKKYPFNEEDYKDGIRLLTTFPRRMFSINDLDMTIQKAGLCPNGSVIVEKGVSGFVLRTEPKYSYTMTRDMTNTASWRLRGDNFEAKQAFKNKMREESIQKMKKENKSKQKDLERIRLQMEEDKKERAKVYKKDISMNTIESARNNEQRTVQHFNCIIQIRLPDSSVLVYNKFKRTDTLNDVYHQLLEDGKISSYHQISFVIPFPKQQIQFSEFDQKTLENASLIPRGSLIVQVS